MACWMSGMQQPASRGAPGPGERTKIPLRDLAVSSACSALAICGPLYVQPPDAAEALRFALGRFNVRDFDDAGTLDANYLRRSDAEVVRAAKTRA